MPTSGYILNGVYHKSKKVPLEKMVTPQQSTYKLGDHARQRFDHSAEILQPYDHKGEPNKKFIEANPDESVAYGFLPRTDPPPEHAAPAEGSVAWGQVKP